MKLIKHNDELLELRGRQRQKGEAGSGLWVLWVVACAFLAVSGFIWIIGDEKEDHVWAIITGLFGTSILLVGVSAALKREKLVFELKLDRGIYTTWSPWRGSRVARRFRFDEIDSFTLREVTEAVSKPAYSVGEGLPQVYDKLELRLRIRPRTVIRVSRSSNQQRVRELAATLSAIPGVPIVE